MFENLSFENLQILWWIIISLLGGLFAFIMFVQGGQSMVFSLPKDELQKDMLINSLGRKWELGFTTLVLFGGACFAAFPKFYSVSFGGAYFVWMAILICFIIQAVSYEYRKKSGNLFGSKGYEIMLFINGTLGVFLLGVALATLFSGADFRLTEDNFVIWEGSARGLEALLSPFNLLFGVVLVFLSKSIASMYLINNIDSAPFRARAKGALKFNAPIFVVSFVLFVALLMLKSGVVVSSDGVATMANYKYFNALLSMPLVAFIFLIGVFLVLFAIYKTLFKDSTKAIWCMGFGVVLSVFAVLLIAGLNGSAFYQSNYALEYSLTIQNSSGSRFTLMVMSYAALLVPFVLAYIFYAWKQMDRVKITEEEIKNSDHIY